MSKSTKKLDNNNGLLSIDNALLSNSDKLKCRIMKVKTHLPDRAYIPLYVMYFGNQTKEQKEKIRRCYNLRESDEGITINLEKIASDNAKRGKKINELSVLAHEINENSFKRKK